MTLDTFSFTDPYKIGNRGKGTFDDYPDQVYDDDTRPKVCIKMGKSIYM